jgi:ferredoxin
MDDKEVYRTLRDKLAVTPMGVPEGDEFIEILSIIFTPEEAALAALMPFMPAPLSEITEAVGVEEGKVKKILDGMADKGVVYTFEYEGTPMYMLFTVLPGIFEFPIMKKTLDIDYPRLLSLWKEYHERGWDREDEPKGAVPLGRVLTVEEELTAKKDVLPRDLVYSYIDEAKYISVGDCSCRTVVGACNAPKEVCLGIGYGAKFLAERGIARLIDKEEAKAIVQKAHDAGLVSACTNTSDRIEFICHCCPCCCGMLSVATKHGRYDLRPISTYVACVDTDTCTACASCEESCPMGAITIDDTADIDGDKCIGCGLCISVCPEEALLLTTRKPEPVVYKNIQEWSQAAVTTRGTAEAFAKELVVKSKEEKSE